MMDCAGECFGEAILDSCDICFGGNTGVTACGQDCAEEWGGDAIEDMCGTCDADTSNDCTQDCANVWGGTSWLSDCGCVSIDNSGDNCDDCAGVPNGNSEIDCAGVCDGDAIEDMCGTCDDDLTNDCEQDCADVWGGDSPDTDNDGICDWNDGDSYETINIGGQLWMKENLKVTHYRNGDLLPTGYSGSEWTNLSTGAYTVYPTDGGIGNPSNIQELCGDNCADVFGNLFNWYAVDDERGICPDGWHIPTETEFETLRNYLGEADLAGGKLKECTEGYCPESEYWVSPNTGATNESGFTGLPSGLRHGDSINQNPGLFQYLSQEGHFWLSGGGGNVGDYFGLKSNSSNISDGYHYKNTGLSVRCIKD